MMVRRPIRTGATAARAAGRGGAVEGGTRGETLVWFGAASSRHACVGARGWWIDESLNGTRSAGATGTTCTCRRRPVQVPDAWQVHDQRVRPLALRKTDNLQSAWFNGAAYESGECGALERHSTARRRGDPPRRDDAPLLWRPGGCCSRPIGSRTRRMCRRRRVRLQVPQQQPHPLHPVNRAGKDVGGGQLSVAPSKDTRYFDCYRGVELTPKVAALGAMTISFDLEQDGHGCAIGVSGDVSGACSSSQRRWRTSRWCRSATSAPRTYPQTLVHIDGSPPASRCRLGWSPSRGGQLHVRRQGDRDRGDDTHGVDVQFLWEEHPQREHQHMMPPAAFIDKYPATNANYLVPQGDRPSRPTPTLAQAGGNASSRRLPSPTRPSPHLAGRGAVACACARRLSAAPLVRMAVRGTGDRRPAVPVGPEQRPVKIPEADDRHHLPRPRGGHGARARRRLSVWREWHGRERLAVHGRIPRRPHGTSAPPRRPSAPPPARPLVAHSHLARAPNTSRSPAPHRTHHPSVQRAVILRGGSNYRPSGSGWYFPTRSSQQCTTSTSSSPTRERAATVGVREGCA